MSKTNRQCISYRPRERIPKLNAIMWYMGYDVKHTDGRIQRIAMDPAEVIDKLIDMGYAEVLRQLKEQEDAKKAKASVEGTVNPDGTTDSPDSGEATGGESVSPEGSDTPSTGTDGSTRD